MARWNSDATTVLGGVVSKRFAHFLFSSKPCADSTFRKILGFFYHDSLQRHPTGDFHFNRPLKTEKVSPPPHVKSGFIFFFQPMRDRATYRKLCMAP